MELSLIPSQLVQLDDYSSEHGYVERKGFADVDITSKIGDEHDVRCNHPILQNLLGKYFPEKSHGRVNISVILWPEEREGRIIIGCVTSAAKTDCLSRLASACGGIENITMDCKLQLQTYRVPYNVKFEKTDEEINRMQRGDDFILGINHIYTIDRNYPLEVMRREWQEDNEPFGVGIEITLKLNHQALQVLMLNGVRDHFVMYKNLLHEGFLSDTVITGVSGPGVDCHKLILIAHSPVFKSMFESTMQEAVTSSVEIPEMTETGVKAFVAYLYHRDIIESSKCCSIALELLLAGDKYDIPCLADSMWALILAKNDDWFTVSVALQMFHFAGTKQEITADDTERKKFEDVADRASLALKSKFSEDLENCPEYQEIFKKNPILGMKLCTYFIAKKY